MNNKFLQYYANYDEEQRLQREPITKIEFDTTIHFLAKYLNKNSTISEFGAGTGAYSFYYTHKGHKVTAIEIVPEYVKGLKTKAKESNISISIYEANAISVDFIASNSQDAVLILGPLYHIKNQADRHALVIEAKRIVKTGGIIAMAYISRLFLPVYLLKFNPELITAKVLKKLNKTGLVTEPSADEFLQIAYFSSPQEMEELATNIDLEIMTHIATDGVSRYIGDNSNIIDEDKYKVWLDYHLSVCHEPSLLGSSSHGLVITKKL